MMKLWEVHALRLGDAIRTTPDGEADIEGLVFSEKAYIVAVRDYRPAQLVDMVRRHGPEAAADNLVSHFAEDSRGLARTRSRIGGPGIVRGDELAVAPVFDEVLRR
jgi:hypothetical protein